MPVQSALYSAALEGDFEFVKKYMEKYKVNLTKPFHVRSNTMHKSMVFDSFLDYYILKLRQQKQGSCSLSQLQILCLLYSNFIQDKLSEHAKKHIRKYDLFENEKKVLNLLKNFEKNIDELRREKDIPKDFLGEILAMFKTSFARYATLKTLRKSKEFLVYDNELDFCTMLISRVCETLNIATKLNSNEKNILASLLNELMTNKKQNPLKEKFAAMLQAIVIAHNKMQEHWLFANMDKVILEKILKTVINLLPDNRIDDQTILSKVNGKLIFKERDVPRNTLKI